MSILVVGSVAFDDVTSPSGSVKNILGGAATYFSLAASYFTKVRIVAVVGEDFGPEQEQVFRQHSIDTRGIERAKGKTFRWGGSYTDNLNESTLTSDLAAKISVPSRNRSSASTASIPAASSEPKARRSAGAARIPTI